MNQHYLIVLLAFLLGQLLITSIMVYRYQKDLHISYWKAMVTYLEAEIGYFIIGLVTVIVICFVLSDFIDLSVTQEDLRSLEHRSWKENLQLYFKTSSLILGSFAQLIAFKYLDKGKDAIDKAVNKIQP